MEALDPIDWELLWEGYNVFFDEIETIVEKKIPDNIRNKNVNVYRIHIEGAGSTEITSHLCDQLKVAYNIYGPYAGGFIDSSIKKRSKEILSGKQLIFPQMLYDSGSDIYEPVVLLFLENKDQWGGFREKIRRLVEGMSGGKNFGWNNN